MFSIVCPVYNKENQLVATVNSVLKQSFGEFELILVDNNSTDNSLEILNSFSDPRVKVRQEKKPGPGAARNNGVYAATFDWIAYLDADDLWEEDYLENYKTAIENHPSCVFFSSCWDVGNDSGSAPASIKNKLTDLFQLIDLKKFMEYSILNTPPVWTSVAVARKEDIVQVGAMPEHFPDMGEEVALWFKLMAKTNMLVVINKVLAHYILHEDEMYSSNFSAVIPGLVYPEVKRELESRKFPEMEILLKSYSNKYILAGIAKSIVSDKFRPDFLSYFYPEANMKYWRILNLMRLKIFRLLYKSYLKNKNKPFHG